jgi:endo-1,4-beta-D-glucanase Y
MTVIADPVNSGQKSLRIVASGYNQAAIIPVPNLPYALQNYATLSFRINITSGNDLNNKPVLVYAAGDVSAFKDHGFGNPADSTYPQFAANLAGQTPATDFSATTYKDKWTTFTITLSPGSSIGSLKGNFFIAFGFNSETATYLVDDLVFTIKDSFTPPVIPPAPSPPSTGAVASGNYRNLFSELGKSSTEITAKVNTTWNRLFGSDTDYKVYYEVAGDMAYIYDSGNDDVRSEGMSYGMMMAVQMNKQTEFNKLWRWAKTNMYNETNQKNCRGYFAWQCGTNGNKKDAGCAPDGEFYFATALLFAHARWGSGSGVLDYRKHAMQLLYDMIHRTSPPDNYGEPAMFRNTDYNGAGKYMTVFQPQGSAGEFTDPSYHLPAFYEVWAIELEKDANAGNLHGIWDNAAAMKTDAAFYRSAVAASRGLFKNAVNATTGLGPDYSHFTGTAYGSDAHSHFEYDAFRTVMNAAMDYSWFAVDSWQKTYADTLQSFFHSKGVNSYTALWTLTGTSRGGDHSPGLIACNAVASLAATHQRAWDFLDDFWEISMTPGRYRYYDGCLYMLGLLHVTGNFKAYLSSGTYTPNPGISPTSATFDKRSTLQQDIVVSMTLNGNTLSNIRNGATTLTSGATANYTVSGSTVTIRKEYLATLANGAVTLTFNFSGGSASTLSITITDTTPSAVISPTSATFDKRSDLRADIPVTMTLNGYNFTRVQNGTTNLTSDTDYTVSGTTVTLKTSYLALQPNGTTTLTFVFSGGSNKDIAITIRETAAGATPGGGTKIDFSTNPSVTLAYVGSNVSASVTGGALRVVSSGSYNGAGVILTLDLGSQNLNSFTGIKLVYRGVTGDTGSKDFIVEVPTTAGGTLGNLGSNTRLITQRVSGTTTETYNKINFTGTVPSRTGELKIAVGLYNTGAVTYDIISIELVP